jgi:predicted GTPase
MINAISAKSRMAAISHDGQLCTQKWTCYRTGRLKLWDCPAINKRSGENPEYSTAFNSIVHPDIIWLILNYKNVDMDDEQELCNILKIDRQIPVIVVINKVDLLHKMTNLTDADIIAFSEQQPLDIFSKKTTLLNLRQQIYDKWPCFMKVKAVTISSLSDGEEEEIDQSRPIGINALLEITRRYLEGERKDILDTLKHENKWRKIVYPPENSEQPDIFSCIR